MQLYGRPHAGGSFLFCEQRGSFEGLRNKKTVVASTQGEYLVMTGMSSSGAASEVGHVQPESESTEGGLGHETTLEELWIVDRSCSACRYGATGFWCNDPIGKVRCLRRYLTNDRSTGGHHQQPIRNQ